MPTSATESTVPMSSINVTRLCRARAPRTRPQSRRLTTIELDAARPRRGPEMSIDELRTGLTEICRQESSRTIPMLQRLIRRRGAQRDSRRRRAAAAQRAAPPARPRRHCTGARSVSMRRRTTRDCREVLVLAGLQRHLQRRRLARDRRRALALARVAGAALVARAQREVVPQRPWFTNLIVTAPCRDGALREENLNSFDFVTVARDHGCRASTPSSREPGSPPGARRTLRPQQAQKAAEPERHEPLQSRCHLAEVPIRRYRNHGSGGRVSRAYPGWKSR